MRRMMHAAAFALTLTLSSFVRAQSDSPLSPSDTVGSRSILASSNAPTHQIVSPEFMSAGFSQPTSQLAPLMNCTSCSPNLWNGYASERAALAAKVSQHVDGQCKCFEGKCHLHNSPSSPCGNGDNCGSSGVGCGSGKGSCLTKNRYREPCSTLYAQPSSVPGRACKLKHRSSGGSASCGGESSCGDAGCESCGCQSGPVSHPIHANGPALMRMATPSKNRLAQPEYSLHRAASVPGMNAEQLR
jgi:hypothetical protein